MNISWYKYAYKSKAFVEIFILCFHAALHPSMQFGSLVFLIFAFCGLVSGQSRPTFHRCNWCGINAECTSGEYCRCPNGLEGDPYFICYNPAVHDVCQITDDPLLITEMGENVVAHYFPDAVLHDKFVRPPRGEFIECTLRIFDSRMRMRGKSLPRSIRIRSDLKDFIGRPRCSVDVEVFVSANENGDIQWRIMEGFLRPGEDYMYVPRTHWDTLTQATDVPAVLHYYDCMQFIFTVTSGRMLQIEVERCDQIVGIRPFIKKTDWLKSGYFTMTSRQRRFPSGTPPYRTPGFPLCLGSRLLKDVTANVGVQDPRHAMSYIAMANLPDNLIVNISPDRKALGDALVKCSAMELQNLFQQVDFMTNWAPFIREISGRTEGFTRIMDMIKRAADWFCEGDVSSCRSILAEISNNVEGSGLVTRHPKLDAFMRNNCTL